MPRHLLMTRYSLNNNHIHMPRSACKISGFRLGSAAGYLLWRSPRLDYKYKEPH